MATKLEGGYGLSGRATKEELIFCGFPKQSKKAKRIKHRMKVVNRKKSSDLDLDLGIKAMCNCLHILKYILIYTMAIGHVV